MKVNIWYVLVLLILVSAIIYVVLRKRKPQTVIINKKPGEQWTKEELKSHGFTEEQIKGGQQTAFQIGTLFI